MKLPGCGNSSVSTHDEYHCDSLWQPKVGFDYWGILYSMIAPADRHQILPYLGYGKSMSKEAPSHWDDVQVATLCQSPRERSNLWFSRTTWSRRETLVKGSCMLHTLSSGSSGDSRLLLEKHTTTRWLTLPWWCALGQDDLLSCGQDDSLSCEQDDSLSCGTRWFAFLCSRMISSPVRSGWCVLHDDYVVGWLVLLWGHNWLVLLSRHPIHAVWDSWEVPLIWSISREMRIGTIVVPMDASLYLPYSLC